MAGEVAGLLPNFGSKRSQLIAVAAAAFTRDLPAPVPRVEGRKNRSSHSTWLVGFCTGAGFLR